VRKENEIINKEASKSISPFISLNLTDIAHYWFFVLLVIL